MSKVFAVLLSILVAASALALSGGAAFAGEADVADAPAAAVSPAAASKAASPEDAPAAAIPAAEPEAEALADAPEAVETLAAGQAGLVQEGGLWYYYNAAGAKQFGWVTVDGRVRYFDPAQGGAAPQGWFNHANGKTYYFWWNGAGVFAAGAQEIGGKVYGFNDQGHNVVGWATIDGQIRYFDPANGGVAPQGWFTHSNGKTYYFWWGGHGAFATGAQEIGGKAYGFNDQGHKVEGWLAVDGQIRYFDPANGGVAPQGWFKHTNGNDYYFWWGGKGAFATGVQAIGDKYYGFNGAGHLQRSTDIIDGNWEYTLDSDGVATDVKLANIVPGQWSGRNGWHIEFLDEKDSDGDPIIVIHLGSGQISSDAWYAAVDDGDIETVLGNSFPGMAFWSDADYDSDYTSDIVFYVNELMVANGYPSLAWSFWVNIG
ncbi:MAG: hypothetical protein LBS91_06325 [Clostridiales Family XIII bacterium]|jgi:glucan-binding YG repeat protein|nr:hypothetical protein [Clostridiales Family XIII bacterium]